MEFHMGVELAQHAAHLETVPIVLHADALAFEWFLLFGVVRCLLGLGLPPSSLDQVPLRRSQLRGGALR